MNKRKRKGKGKEEEESSDVADKGVVEPFRKSESKVLKLAFSVSPEPGGFQFIHTMLSTLRDNVHLPVLAAMFSERHFDSLVYIDEEETAIFMDRNVSLFLQILERLRIPTISLEPVPKGVGTRFWNGELDYWGYAAPESQVEPEAFKEPTTESRHSEIGKRVDMQSRAVLSILKKYMNEKGVGMRVQSADDPTEPLKKGSKAVLVMWFLNGLGFCAVGETDYPVVKMADWLREWGIEYMDYFEKELDVSGFGINQNTAAKKYLAPRRICKWPSQIFQSSYSDKTGHVEVRLYFTLGASDGQKVK